MVDGTRSKELSAKMETTLAILDQKEEKMKLIQQSLASITKYLEA